MTTKKGFENKLVKALIRIDELEAKLSTANELASIYQKHSARANKAYDIIYPKIVPATIQKLLAELCDFRDEKERVI